MDYKTTIQTYVDSINLDSQEFKSFFGSLSKNHDTEYVNKEKEQLVKRICLMYELGLFEYRSQYWRIKRGRHFKQFNLNIDIEFVPFSKSFSKSLSGNIGWVNRYNDLFEWNFLIDLASRYSITENYDKVEIVKNRLIELIQ